MSKQVPNRNDEEEIADSSSDDDQVVDNDLQQLINYFQGHHDPLQAFENFFSPEEMVDSFELEKPATKVQKKSHEAYPRVLGPRDYSERKQWIPQPRSGYTQNFLHKKRTYGYGY